MEKLLKPGQLVIDPNSPTAGKDWKHWIRRFDGYVSQFTGSMTEGEAEKYKLSVLVNYAVSDVYDYFDHCTTYSEAEAVLKELFVKEPYEIFARYELLTTKQKVNQSLADFGCTLNKLAKDCNFASVTAAEHKDAMVRDAFIAGISSPAIRQRLLEHQKLSYSEAYRLAVTFDDARRNNLKFGSPPDAKVESAMAADDVDFPTNAPLSWKETDQSAFVANRTSGRCMHCGNNRPHDFKSCKARMVNCFKCGKKGHFSRACRSHTKVGSSSRHVNVGDTAAVEEASYALYMLGASGQGREKPVTVFSRVENRLYQTLLDTGSSKCFVSKAVAQNFDVKEVPIGFRVCMAQSSKSVDVTKMCKLDLKVCGRAYKDLAVYVMDGLCADIILGRDFLSLHKKVTFNFGGDQAHLMVPKLNHCAVLAADIKTPSLFANLRDGWEPVATRSRRYNSEARQYISTTVGKWKEYGTVRPSNSPWRAQCVVVKSGGRIERLAIDYSPVADRD